MSGHVTSSESWFDLTPSDVTVHEGIRALFVGTAGDVVAEGHNGVQATFKAVAGETLFIRPKKVLTGTTASAIVGLR